MNYRYPSNYNTISSTISQPSILCIICQYEVTNDQYIVKIKSKIYQCCCHECFIHFKIIYNALFLDTAPSTSSECLICHQTLSNTHHKLKFPSLSTIFYLCSNYCSLQLKDIYHRIKK